MKFLMVPDTEDRSVVGGSLAGPLGPRHGKAFTLSPARAPRGVPLPAGRGARGIARCTSPVAATRCLWTVVGRVCLFVGWLVGWLFDVPATC